MRLELLPPASLPLLVERLEDLRHDLGRYIRFETRFVEEHGDLEALRSALRADLLRTRRHGGQVEPAAAVWRRLRPEALEGDPDVAVIDQAMGALEAADLEGPAENLPLLAAHARAVAEATGRLLARGRAALGGEHG